LIPVDLLETSVNSARADQLDENQMVLRLALCKAASNSRDFCNIACQNVIRAWLEAQFNIKMVSTIQGTDCTVKIVPFNT
jgi:hypothetical protein